MRIISYDYNKISAVKAYGDYLYLAFYTEPGLILQVLKSSPETVVDTFSLAIGTNNIKSIYVDSTHIYAVCDFNYTGEDELIKINKSTKTISTHDLPSFLPTKIIGTDNYVAVLTLGSVSLISIYLKADMSELQVYMAGMGVAINDIYFDANENIWGTIYNESEGKFFKLTIDTAITWTYNEYEQLTYVKLNKIHVDALENIYITTLEEIGSLFKCYIESDDSVQIDRDFTLSTADGNISSINIDAQDNIWLGTSNPCAILKLWEITGSTYDYDSYGETLLSTSTSVPLIEVDSQGVYLGVYSNPGKLMVQDLREKLNITSKIVTRQTTVGKFLFGINYVLRTFLNIGTKFITKVKTDKTIFTDVRWFLQRYNEITPKPLDNTHVYLDGVELTDCDMSTAILNFSLNSTPSSLRLDLYRYHDKFNYTLAGVLSVIDAENKITVYDGTKLLFTGYVTTINAKSEEEKVSIIAEDVRYKLSKESYKKYDPTSTLAMDDGYVYELEYGGKYDTTTNTRTSISTKTAMEDVLSLISSYISGYDSIDFGFTPEYTTIGSDYASIINTLVSISGNYNWYIDENEKLCFQKVEQGDVIELQMSSISGRRNLYDILINDITLNKKTSDYYTAYLVYSGKKHNRVYVRGNITYFSRFSPPNGSANKKEYVLLQFQKDGLTRHYYGLYDYAYTRTISSFPVNLDYGMFYQAQYLLSDNYVDIPPVKVGTGDLVKKVTYSYGYKPSTNRYEEVTFDGQYTKFGITSTNTWLCRTEEERYDYRDFAVDNANFDLSQNNKLITEANISILLDAFNFYNLDFKKRINIINTVETNIYKNKNGFPLNIESYSVNLGTRLVSLNTTNYGKTFYRRSGDYISTYRQQTVVKLYPKLPIILFVGEV